MWIYIQSEFCAQEKLRHMLGRNYPGQGLQMRPLPDVCTIFGQNIRGILLTLFAISSFCGCEAKMPDVKIGMNAPVFSAMDVTGKPVNLNQFKGRIVVIYFWQNSCCADSLKLIEPFYEANRHKDLAIVAVNVGDTKEVVTSYAKRNGLSFTILTDEHSTIFKQYRAIGFPTIFIIDSNGVMLSEKKSWVLFK
jgi:peroxiredoxin